MSKTTTSMFLAALVTLLTSGCTIHTNATGFRGLPTVDGRPQEYLGTTTYSLHLFFIVPLLGDGRMEHTVDKFSEEARLRGAENIRIVDTSNETLWYALPPISFFIHPVQTTVEGELTMPADYVPPPPLPKQKRASARLRDGNGRLTGVDSLFGNDLPDNAQEAIGSDPFDAPGQPSSDEPQSAQEIIGSDPVKPPPGADGR